ncbi:hypothetical protein B0T26DRAFT_678046 [Lasiosphaeria miniovina]|uniref:F-box domain-containing protein n=1 Tax=Lasiosphaeria miniovina TaxID=1954250 RepID=A0AA40ADG6_9PEZI|nr:uncharacterized protein B0T26DRAFT_678046 [Lasiosphaeria miniovina]KAK0713754.1 hypothetical protein B0T26DRAFT_678046 [Lasiosphaeria miniovina]
MGGKSGYPRHYNVDISGAGDDLGYHGLEREITRLEHWPRYERHWTYRYAEERLGLAAAKWCAPLGGKPGFDIDIRRWQTEARSLRPQTARRGLLTREIAAPCVLTILLWVLSDILPAIFLLDTTRRPLLLPYPRPRSRSRSPMASSNPSSSSSSGATSARGGGGSVVPIRRAAGTFFQLLHLPVELRLEIGDCLDLSDAMHMARSCRQLRDEYLHIVYRRDVWSANPRALTFAVIQRVPSTITRVLAVLPPHPSNMSLDLVRTSDRVELIPLICAIRTNDDDFLLFLLQNGADPNARSPSSRRSVLGTTLHFALTPVLLCPESAITAMLLHGGANPNSFVRRRRRMPAPAAAVSRLAEHPLRLLFSAYATRGPCPVHPESRCLLRIVGAFASAGLDLRGVVPASVLRIWLGKLPNHGQNPLRHGVHRTLLNRRVPGCSFVPIAGGSFTF